MEAEGGRHEEEVHPEEEVRGSRNGSCSVRPILLVLCPVLSEPVSDRSLKEQSESTVAQTVSLQSLIVAVVSLSSCL